MQKYQSKQNIKQIQDSQPRAKDKDAGDMSFEIEPNTSLKLTINFKSDFKSLPYVFTQMISPDNDFDLTSVVINKTNKNFVANIQNLSSQSIKGLLSWFAFTSAD